MGTALEAALVHLLEQRLERPEVGVALKLVAGEPLAEQVVLAHARLHPPRLDQVGQLDGLAALPGADDHPLMVAVKLAEQREHGCVFRQRGSANRRLASAS